MKRAREVVAIARGIAGEAHYDKRLTWRGRPVRFGNRGPAAQMGRFGGGWERQIGVQLGRRGLEGTIIINLWRGSIRIDPAR